MPTPPPQPPTITICLTINPPIFPSLSTPQDLPIITLTATSQAPAPLTIFTHPTIFNLPLSQKRKNFRCHDKQTQTPISLELTKGPQRRSYSRTENGPDDIYFQTLEPGVPVVFTDVFRIAGREMRGGGAVLAEGRRFVFGLSEGEMVKWWWHGRREDVMGPPGVPAVLEEPRGEAIVLRLEAPVEFEVRRRESG